MMLRSLFRFLGHQFIATWGVGIFAYFASSATLDTASLLGWHISARFLHWILTETPFFPVQIALGFYSGWLLARMWKHRAMVYVWIIPALILLYCLIAEPTPFSGIVSIFQRGGNPFSHFFGWGCRPQDHCLDELLITMPFYAATAYSLGGLIYFKFWDN